MQACATALRLFAATYRPVLSADVVNVEATDASISYPESDVGWFCADKMHYAFAIGTSDLSALQKATWNRYLDYVMLRRLQRLGYPTDSARALSEPFVNLLNRWENDRDGHTKYRVVPSTDARIDTKRVLSSLLALLGTDATVIPSANYELSRVGDTTAVRIDGETHVPDLCVVAAGKMIPKLLNEIGFDELARGFKSVSSPIVVLKDALDLPNFIRFTPNLPETLNHVRYSVGGRDVSTIGSYDFHPADQSPDLAPFEEKICRRIGVSTSEVVGSYYGTKTELSGQLARRYNHAVEPVNKNTYVAIAGKFSQFPLLVNDFAKKLGLRWDIANDERGVLPMVVADTAPEKLLRSAGISTGRNAA